MQSTDTDQASLDALAEYALSSNLRNDPLVIDLCAALAAERDRADRAQARIAARPHDELCAAWNISGGESDDGCTCWKSEATA